LRGGLGKRPLLVMMLVSIHAVAASLSPASPCDHLWNRFPFAGENMEVLPKKADPAFEPGDFLVQRL
jgi:hypothetical protein